MSYDRQATRSVWEGKIPIAFRLADADLSSLKRPEDVYMMVHRCCHFPLVLSEVIQSFQTYATKGNDTDEVWLESNGVPLKAHYPIGVLFDLHGSSGPLPWTVTVHFRNFPADRLIRFSGDETVKAYFFNMVKQAEAIKTGSTKRIMSLSMVDSNQLWEGYFQHNYTKYWGINGQLAQFEDAAAVKGVPFRVYLPESTVLQKQIPPLNPSGQPETLEGLLRDVAPHLFEGSKTPKIIIQGISPSLSSPIAWLSENLSHPDNFLHIVVAA